MPDSEVRKYDAYAQSMKQKSDDAATGCITTRRPEDAERQHISRADTARIIAHVIRTGQSRNITYELYRGDTPFADLIA